MVILSILLVVTRAANAGGTRCVDFSYLPTEVVQTSVLPSLGTKSLVQLRRSTRRNRQMVDDYLRFLTQRGNLNQKEIWQLYALPRGTPTENDSFFAFFNEAFDMETKWRKHDWDDHGYGDFEGMATHLIKLQKRLVQPAGPSRKFVDHVKNGAILHKYQLPKYYPKDTYRGSLEIPETPAQVTVLYARFRELFPELPPLGSIYDAEPILRNLKERISRTFFVNDDFAADWMADRELPTPMSVLIPYPIRYDRRGEYRRQLYRMFNWDMIEGQYAVGMDVLAQDEAENYVYFHTQPGEGFLDTYFVRN